MTAQKQYDLLIIGSGSAGYSAAKKARDQGLSVGIVSEREGLIGHCILHGCMPGKVFVEAADHFLVIERARKFGIEVSHPKTNQDRLLQHKAELIGEFADYRHKQLLEGDWDLHQCSASFIDQHHVQLSTGAILFGRSIVVATGSELNDVPIPGLEEAGYLTSDRMMEGASCPHRLTIIGGGAVALEAAHYYSAFGCKVVILQRSKDVLTRMDPDLTKVVADALRKRGVEILCESEVQRVSLEGGNKCVHFLHRGEQQQIGSDEILFAWGRKARTASLQLERTGVELREGEIAVNEFQQTNIPHIFAAGDVCSNFPVLRNALREGCVAAQNAALQLQGQRDRFERMDLRAKMFCLFTHPQLSSVGLTEKEARAAGLQIQVGGYPFAEVGKALVLAQAVGTTKIIAEQKTGKVLGAGMVGPLASELIALPAAVIHFGGTIKDLIASPVYHPTLVEAWSSAAEEMVG